MGTNLKTDKEKQVLELTFIHTERKSELKEQLKHFTTQT